MQKMFAFKQCCYYERESTTHELLYDFKVRLTLQVFSMQNK